MLKNIRLHLDKDEQKQADIEAGLSKSIQQQYQNNVAAFRHHIPSLMSYIEHVSSQNISIIYNKWSEANIVDYGVGRTFYGLSPAQEIDKHLDIQLQHCKFIDVSAASHAIEAESELSEAQNQCEKSEDDLLWSNFRKQEYFSALPTKVPVLVLFGLGIGRHIKNIIENYQIEHLVIYEPELQYFQCSIFAGKWDEILALAKKKKTTLYFQLEKDGRDLVSDINELIEHLNIKGFYFYKHYNHPIFNVLELSLNTRSWCDIKNKGINFGFNDKADQYLPHWTQAIDLSSACEMEEVEQSRLEQNLKAFKKYFPNIYKEFKVYKPKTWFPVKMPNGEINVVKGDLLTPWYGDEPKQECILNFNNFSEQPNKDGLVLGYKGTKLKDYTHYQFVNETETLLKEVEDDIGSLPDTLKSLILFGVGVGYQITHLFENHKIEKLFLCEPNRDFFYASLHAIDWKHILETIDEQDGRLYINIGDDGTNLFNDLLNQFYAIGPYVLASTYFYQSYYNANLVQAIAQLREQLQIVVSMGEYFDHARYGIAHTKETIKRGYGYLKSNAKKCLTFDNREVPVFIVGNGPSLDNAIETIKEWQGQAIVVSCGTALMPLYKNGITPDFHAEIEQNRSTFDWCCRVGDFDYLKSINLISCNGIHPDTCDLFHDVFISFKEGESSTVSALNILGRKNYEELKFAFPTVSNFAVNIFSKIGFKQLYFFGVDLGFYDKKKHHSKQSGYYNDDGKEAYDYEAKNNTSLVVPGNYRKTVFTKHEFKVSKAIIEQSLASSKVECFNCSDGAKIMGSKPLALDYVLISSTSEQKENALNTVKKGVFISPAQANDYQALFDEKYKKETLAYELDVFIKKTKSEFNSTKDVDKYIESQKNMLFASYQKSESLLFYLLYGTVNYANAVMTKLCDIKSDRYIKLALEKWADTLNKINIDYLTYPNSWDFCSSFSVYREEFFLSKLAEKISVTAICETDQRFCDYINKETFSEESKSDLVAFVAFDKNCNRYLPLKKENSLLCSYEEFNYELIKNSSLYTSDNSSACWWLGNYASNKDYSKFFSGDIPLCFTHNRYFYRKFVTMLKKVFLFLPKYKFLNSSEEQKKTFVSPILIELQTIDCFVEFFDYIAIPKKAFSEKDISLDSVGSRGRIVRNSIQWHHLVMDDYTESAAKRKISWMDW